MRALRIALAVVTITSIGLSGNLFAKEKGQALFLKSLVIPGWGQYEAGRTTHALAFLSADLLFIGSALSLSHHGHQLRDDYEAFAAAHAGVSGSHGKEFYIDVANWISVFDYNEQRMADRSFGALYDTETEYWMWDSEGSRARMDEMRLTFGRSLNRVIYAVALIGVNHVVSAFHAGRLQSQAKKQNDSRVGWNLTPQHLQGGGRLNFSLQW